jgi:hypothetical protein
MDLELRKFATALALFAMATVGVILLAPPDTAKADWPAYRCDRYDRSIGHGNYRHLTDYKTTVRGADGFLYDYVVFKTVYSNGTKYKNGERYYAC